jgi:hypothetical protein
LGRTDDRLTRRSFLASAAVLGIAASNLSALQAWTATPRRLPVTATPELPDIQFAISDYLSPAVTVDGVMVQYPPVYTHHLTCTLARTPTVADQAALAAALDTVEASYPFSASGVFTTIAYGLPYFARLPGGVRGPLAAATMPRLLSDPTRYALEEAVPGPTDVGGNPGQRKQRFNLPVRIEGNDLVVTVRSDTTTVLADVLAYLTGNSATLHGSHVGNSRLGALLQPTSSRLMFVQPGLPRHLADANNLPYAGRINPASPMWMGFADQQRAGAGPPPITTFAGDRSARLTTAVAGDYFDNGAVLHLSHVIEDLAQFYADPAEPFTERVQYAFRSNPIPSVGNADQFTDGGGPAFIENTYFGADNARRDAQGTGTYQGEHRMGHLAGLQRSSRAADGTPMHIRADGPGFDSLDIPDGSPQPKLHFAIYVPSADFFANLRRHQASLDLVAKYHVDDSDNGFERFITATRRQNFLVPPRRHRAFPLVELA